MAKRRSGPTTGAIGLMSTRITGGSERGRRLRSSKRTGLRPTSDKIRAAIFSMIGRDAVEGARVLDLYAGTGALGIEALSRGAKWADFVETHPGQCQAIRESLSELGLDSRGHVYRAKAEKALDVVTGTYGFVLIDPPYDQDPWALLMNRLASGQSLEETALVVAEHHYRHQLAERYGRLAKVTSRRHGDTSISIYRAGVSNG